MAVVYVPQDGGQVRLIALTADTLPTTNMNAGDKAIITDGPDKLFDGTSWVDDTTDLQDSGGTPVEGGVAHGSADSGNPVKIGGKAESTEPTAESDNDRVDAWFDLKGRLVTHQKSRTGTVTSVADSATNVTVLALNEARVGASIVNDSSARLYLKCGATASTTSYTVSLAQYESYEVPFGYTGIIDGIWASDPGDGAARVTEFT